MDDQTVYENIKREQEGQKNGRRGTSYLTLFQFCVEVLADHMGKFSMSVARNEFDLLHENE